MKEKNSWPTALLSEIIATVDYGLTASATKESVGPKFLRITDIQDGGVDWKKVPFCHWDGEDQKRYELAPGDIVFARTGATTGKSCLIRECPPGSVFASYLIRVRPNSEVDPAYLFRFFQTADYWRQISSKSTGTAQPGVNATNLKSLLIPLPPLAEQRRIAAILNTADALREKRRQIIPKYDTLLRAVFLGMFGDPVKNPKGWHFVAMEEIFAISPNFGTMIPPTDSGEWLSLRVGNIQNWSLDLSDSKFVNLPEDCFERHSVQDGDLLMARAIASQAHLGKCVIVYPRDRKWAFDSHLMRLRLDQKLATPDYVRHFLMTPGGRSLFLKKTRRSTVQYNINTKEIAALRLPLPPIAQQEKFAKIVASVEQVKAKQIELSLRFDDLFQALQQRAFTGKLFAEKAAAVAD